MSNEIKKGDLVIDEFGRVHEVSYYGMDFYPAPLLDSSPVLCIITSKGLFFNMWQTTVLKQLTNNTNNNE